MKTIKTRILTWIICFVALFILISGRISADGMSIHQVRIAYGSAIKLKIKLTYDQTDARSMLKLINDFRTGSSAWYYKQDGSKKRVKDLKKLTYDYTLEKAAKQRAAEIALSFSHTRPDGSSCFTVLGSKYELLGENICGGFKTAEDAFAAWLETDEDYSGQGHRRNMLYAGFNAVGIAKATFNGRTFYVQEFGYTDDPDTEKTKADDSTKTVTVSTDTKADGVLISDVETSVSKITFGIGMKSALPAKAAAKVSFEEAWGHDGISASEKISWSTTSDCVRIVDGEVIGVEAGTATLTAKAFGKKLKIKVTVLPTPKITKITLTKESEAKVTWKAIDGAAKYRVFRKLEGGRWKRIADTSSTSYVDPSVQSDETYYYTVRCISKDGQAYTSNYDKKGKMIVIQ